MLDLDGFKGVSDRLGHPAGDEILRAVAMPETSRGEAIAAADQELLAAKDRLYGRR